MKNTLRLAITLSAISAAVASQALALKFDGSTTTTTPTAATYAGTTSYQSPFAFTTAVANGNLITLTGGLTGSLVLTINSTVDTSGPGIIALTSTATASGTYGGVSYTGTGLSVAFNSNQSTGLSPNSQLSVLGNVNPVPEPSAFAALGLGAAAFIRRRRKA